MVEQALEEKLPEHLAARSHERTVGRRGYRNGHYQRRLLTHHGEIPDLAVPRAEEGGVEFQTLGRYQRRRLETRFWGNRFWPGSARVDCDN